MNKYWDRTGSAADQRRRYPTCRRCAKSKQMLPQPSISLPIIVNENDFISLTTGDSQRSPHHQVMRSQKIFKRKEGIPHAEACGTPSILKLLIIGKNKS